MKRITLGILTLACFLNACRKPAATDETISPDALAEVLSRSTEMMVHDVSNPPLAARFFSYIHLAGTLALNAYDTASAGILDQLNGFPAERPGLNPAAHPELTALLSMMEVSSRLQPSGESMRGLKKNFLDSCLKNGWSKQRLDAVSARADTVAKIIMAYAAADGYRKLSERPVYAAKEGKGYWYPTPPGYFPAVEPHFPRIRPFLIDSSALEPFSIPDPAAYDEDSTSEFYRLTLEVYDVARSAEGRPEAAFWDCNPFALQSSGHLMIGMKKISPGAHWMGISQIACRKAALDFRQTLRVQTLVSVALMDAFWLCWREKYRTERIRPETAIRKLIDPTWEPFLQTPPFPEYPSGHSVASTAAASVLTGLFGDRFAYTDSVERRYGLPDRSYPSFLAAAEEASLSRLYGGIHFRDGITQGQKLGASYGRYFVGKMSVRELLPQQ